MVIAIPFHPTRKEMLTISLRPLAVLVCAVSLLSFIGCAGCGGCNARPDPDAIEQPADEEQPDDWRFEDQRFEDHPGYEPIPQLQA